jgi:LemA protein
MQGLVDFITGLIQLAFFLAIVLAVVAVWGYNTLRRLAENVKEAQSNIDVALRKKVSLVNQLGDVAGKYMDRESLVMLKVSQDATEAATTQLYQQTGTVLSTIQGLAQKFPELRASEQYSNLAAAITHSESDVQNYRVQCNAAIKTYNTQRSSLPHALYAGFLGFRPARYLELDTVESSDASVQKQIISDDGDRLNELLGMAGTKVLGATKTLASQGKLMAEKAATRVQTEIAARQALAPALEYTYLDASRLPKGPVSRDELDSLFRLGEVTADTDVLEAGSKSWTKYSSLSPTSAV